MPLFRYVIRGTLVRGHTVDFAAGRKVPHVLQHMDRKKKQRCVSHFGLLNPGIKKSFILPLI